MADTRPQTEPDELTGLKSLGRRITRRTFDLTAFAIVTVGLITIAVRLAGWWQLGDETGAVTPGITAQSQFPWGIGEEGAWLAFGDATWSARHLTLMGSADEVRQRIVDDCGSQLAERSDLSTLPELTPQESDLIARLTALAPIAIDDAGTWQVYALDGPLLAVFGVVGNSPDVVGNDRRIACWGIALPAGEAIIERVDTQADGAGLATRPLWSVWMIDPGGSIESGADRGPLVPIPPGGNRVLSIRDPMTGGIDTVRGPGTIGVWQNFYSDWLRGHGADHSTWSGDAHHTQLAAIIQHNGAAWRCDVLLSESDTGEVECVVNLVESAKQ